VYQWPQVEALMREAIEAFEHENGVKYVDHNARCIPGRYHWPRRSFFEKATDAAIAAVVARHKEGA